MFLWSEPKVTEMTKTAVCRVAICCHVKITNLTELTSHLQSVTKIALISMCSFPFLNNCTFHKVQLDRCAKQTDSSCLVGLASTDLNNWIRPHYCVCSVEEFLMELSSKCHGPLRSTAHLWSLCFNFGEGNSCNFISCCYIVLISRWLSMYVFAAPIYSMGTANMQIWFQKIQIAPASQT